MAEKDNRESVNSEKIEEDKQKLLEKWDKKLLNLSPKDSQFHVLSVPSSYSFRKLSLT